LLLLLLGGASDAVEIKSPDARLVVNVSLSTVEGTPGCPVYTVNFQGQPVLQESRLGLTLADGPLLSGLRLRRQSNSTSDTVWQPVCGERARIRDHYNEVVLDLEQAGTPVRRLQLTFRVYNEGAAFCYTIPAPPGATNVIIQREHTQFAFTGDHAAWAVYRAQGNYDPGPVRLSKLKPGVERPLTVQVATNLYCAISEARLVDYARMKLRPTPDAPHTLEALLDGGRGTSGTVTGTLPFTSPWRVVAVAESPGQLLEQNGLILNLNEPCALADPSWIKPGKVIREVTLTTGGGKACVDFAVQHGLQYIEYDAGWYGYEYDAKSDARAVHLDPRRNPDPDSLNLREVIDYANTNGIGVILYVNHVALEQQLDELLPLYQSWGVKGVKYGFVNVGSQRWTAWLHAAIRKAAAYRLMVDVHDEFRSTGYERTYPNLMTCEGVGGNEEFPAPVHNATLPFTRFLTGPADYTFCWTDARLKVTRVHQMALATIFYSPWQFVFWYAKPGDIAAEPALEYWRRLPTTWDETRVIQGDIGRRVAIARRKGDDWFVGAIAPAEGRFPIQLNFLPAGEKFTAQIYSDASSGPAVSNAVNVVEQAVDATVILNAEFSANGGLAVHLRPTQR
jgi:alpha-glucosidase